MSDPPTISVGDTLAGRLPMAQYRVVERLGAGGMGAVYRVVHQGNGENLALKVLHQTHASSGRLRRRFEREAQALEALGHPNIVRIIDHGTFHDEPYLVMELLLGESLADRLRTGTLSATEVRRVANELLAALAYAHERGVVHRDLKPGNVFLERAAEGKLRCKVLDFGFVKFLEEEPQADPLTRSGEIFGTPVYMAPEQIGGDRASASTDVYALGVLLYEMVAGKPPFDGDVSDIMRGHLIEEPPSLLSVAPQLRPCGGLEALIGRSLQKRPADRFADAGEMRAAFEALPEPLFRRGDADQPLALEPTVLQAEPPTQPLELTPRQTESPKVPRLSGPKSSMVRRGALWLHALLRRIVTAGAIALIIASLAVILVSILIIWGLRDAEGPSGTPGPHALASELIETLGGTDAVLDDANEAQSQPAAASEASPDAQPARSEPHRKLPAARDPFRRPLPPVLRPIARVAHSGGRGSERSVRRLRTYNRQHPRDARGHLLLARLYYNRGWRKDALTQYELATKIDPTARGAERMREHLQALADSPRTAKRASALLERLYGGGATAQAR